MKMAICPCLRRHSQKLSHSRSLPDLLVTTAMINNRIKLRARAKGKSAMKERIKKEVLHPVQRIKFCL